MSYLNESTAWKRTLDGLYHAMLPKQITVSNAVNMWAQIFNDYSEHFAGADPLLVIIDGSQVESYDEKAISIASLHVIPNNTEALIAIHSRSSAYKTISNEFFKTHPMPENMRYFEDEASAHHWLDGALQQYNNRTHR
jgi:hypothetical protein